MAKISANGATEVARIRVRRAGSESAWLLRSDGAVLRKLLDIPGEGWKVIGRPNFVPKDRRTKDGLIALARERQYEVVG